MYSPNWVKDLFFPFIILTFLGYHFGMNMFLRDLKFCIALLMFLGLLCLTIFLVDGVQHRRFCIVTEIKVI